MYSNCTTKLKIIFITLVLTLGLTSCGNGCNYQVIKSTNQITCVPPANAR